MTRPSRGIGRTKAIVQALAMIADAFPEPVPQRRCPARERTNGSGKSLPIFARLWTVMPGAREAN
jgi:hypothetical protein